MGQELKLRLKGVKQVTVDEFLETTINFCYNIRPEIRGRAKALKEGMEITLRACQGAKNPELFSVPVVELTPELRKDVEVLAEIVELREREGVSEVAVELLELVRISGDDLARLRRGKVKYLLLDGKQRRDALAQLKSEHKYGVVAEVLEKAVIRMYIYEGPLEDLIAYSFMLNYGQGQLYVDTHAISLAKVLGAIKRDVNEAKEIMDKVLARMPDSVRSEYSRYSKTLAAQNALAHAIKRMELRGRLEKAAARTEERREEGQRSTTGASGAAGFRTEPPVSSGSATEGGAAYRQEEMGESEEGLNAEEQYTGEALVGVEEKREPERTAVAKAIEVDWRRQAERDLELASLVSYRDLVAACEDARTYQPLGYPLLNYIKPPLKTPKGNLEVPVLLHPKCGRPLACRRCGDFIFVCLDENCENYGMPWYYH